MSKCLFCKRDLSYTSPLPLVTTVEKKGRASVPIRSNGPRTDFRIGYYGHGLFCTSTCAGRWGLGVALQGGKAPPEE